MSIWFILAAMIFLHILDDYGLQSKCLSFLKQKSWWDKEAPDRMYEYDYIWALLMHGFSWAFTKRIDAAFFRTQDVVLAVSDHQGSCAF